MVFRPKEPSQNAIPTMFPSRNHNRRLGAKLMIRELQQRPPRIEYPEDDLRRRFYEEHPFELVNKPATLVEDESKLRDRVLKTWDSVEAGELNGEAWVKGRLLCCSTHR
jgi:small subunit ribosomal protein S23